MKTGKIQGECHKPKPRIQGQKRCLAPAKKGAWRLANLPQKPGIPQTVRNYLQNAQKNRQI
jgi:hypothetical protein